MPFDLFRVGGDGTILDANRAARDAFGPGAAPGLPFPRLWTEDANTVLDRLALAAGSGAWQPLALTRRAEKPFRIRLRARGLPPAGDRAGSVLVLAMPEGPPAADGDDRRTLDLRQQAARLAADLSNDRRLHRAVVHRTRNSLALLTSLLRIGTSHATGLEAKRALTASEHRTMTLGLLHKVLDQAATVDEIDAADLIEPICRRLQAALAPPGVEIVADLPRRALQLADAGPLCLLATELVMHALSRSSVAQGGRVTVRFADAPAGHATLTVCAAGRPDPVARQAPSALPLGTPGVIVGALARQLGGRVEARPGDIWRVDFRPADPLPPDMRP